MTARSEASAPGIYWSETVEHAAPQSLRGEVDVDVAIVGGGFTGLWTAYFLHQAEPTMRIGVVEAERTAHGASGRNGGFATTLLDLSHRDLVHNFGAERATSAHRRVVEAIEAIGAFAAQHEIDYEAAGLLTVATNPQAERWLEADARACEVLGADASLLSRDETQVLVASPTYRRGLYERAGAILNPAKLVSALARVVSTGGVQIYEASAVLSVTSDATPPRVSTPRGALRAGQVVLATNAYTPQLGFLHRAIAPMYSYILLTEPLDDGRWESLAWAQPFGIEDKRHFIHYYRPTADRRLLWGGHDTSYHWGSKVLSRFDQDPAIFAASERALLATFPQLRGVRITHRWGGPIAVSADFLPMFGTLPGVPVHYGLGYSGHGVAPSRIGGEVLANLVLGRKEDDVDSLFLKSASAAFPPEPLRWIGFVASRQSLVRQNHEMAAGTVGRLREPAAMKVLRRLGRPR